MNQNFLYIKLFQCYLATKNSSSVSRVVFFSLLGEGELTTKNNRIK